MILLVYRLNYSNPSSKILGNRFSTLDGVRFAWDTRGLHGSEAVFRIVHLKDTGVDVPSILLDLESKVMCCFTVNIICYRAFKVVQWLWKV